VMGFADLLLLRGEAYGSAASRRTAERVIACVEREARRASEELATQRGPFPAFDGPGPPRRNASLLAIAPTGTLRLLAGCSGGIEPWIDPVVSVRTRDGASQRWVDRTLLSWLERRSGDPATLLDAIAARCAAEQLPGLAAAERSLLRRAHEIPADEQLALQSRFQAHVDGAVAKTVHLSQETSTARIEQLIHTARRLGCKGVAFWRTPDEIPAACVRCAA
jgi:ribonucleoside-diphosphate reductase alpha chain